MCSRLESELQHLHETNAHTDPEDVARREADHKRWHRDCRDYDPGHLSREPERP